MLPSPRLIVAVVSIGLLAAPAMLACGPSSGDAPPAYELRVPRPAATPTTEAGTEASPTPAGMAEDTPAATPTPNATATVTPPPTPAPTLPAGVPFPLQMRLEEVFANRTFEQPVAAFAWPYGGLAVVDRLGEISVHVLGQQRRLILTLAPAYGGELGLLSAVLDPEFDTRPYLYVYYHPIEDAHQGRTVGRVSRFPVANGVVTRDEELVIMAIRQIEALHNGGALRFGPDGMLYLGLGDSERPRDAQHLRNLRGKIIRIDVRAASEEEPYRIPPDNPFVGVDGARPEIWAYGLRNPWRMSFTENGVLVVADVGHTSFEEVSVATAGANLGWPVFEGFSCQDEPAACEELAGTTMPLVTYGRDAGCAIIGGEHPYLFGDYCTGRIWSLEVDPQAETGWAMRELAQTDDLRILGFGTDEDGGVLVLTADGPILRLEAVAE